MDWPSSAKATSLTLLDMQEGGIILSLSLRSSLRSSSPSILVLSHRSTSTPLIALIKSGSSTSIDESVYSGCGDIVECKVVDVLDGGGGRG